MTLADRDGEKFQMMGNRTTYADALHAAGEWEKAVFSSLMPRGGSGSRNTHCCIRCKDIGTATCFFRGDKAAAARGRAAQTVQWARTQNIVLDIALDTLTLGRAHLVLALLSLASRPSAETASADACVADAKLGEAVEGLRASGINSYLPRGLLARAAFRRAVGDMSGAARDCDEVEEIAEPGPMRLFLCDCALERARLALARLEAFAPLNGLVERSLSPPALLDAAAAAGLREEARRELDAARKLIADCGYHRRDEGLNELDVVVAGRRRFADLPPRV